MLELPGKLQEVDELVKSVIRPTFPFLEREVRSPGQP